MSSDTSEEKIELEQEILVTGTNIRGLQNRTVPLETYSKDDIDRSGYSSVQQFFDNLPKNFRGGSTAASEDGRFSSSTGSGNNLSLASGINLRGLGTAATLTLVNGHRMAPSVFGQLVDISLIPLAAIERIDVLSDGSSALYGSDAMAGAVNIVLKRDYDGAETQASYGQAAGGNAAETIFNQTFGRKWQGGGAVVAGNYHQRDELKSSERAFTAAAFRPTDILPRTEQHNFIASVHQDVGARIRLFADGYFTEKSGRQNATSATRQDLNRWNERSFAASAGGQLDLVEEWQLELFGSYSKDQTGTKVVMLPLAIPNYVNGSALNDVGAEVWTADGKLDGRILDLPGGALRIAAMASYREERGHRYLMYNRASDRFFGRRVSAQSAEIYAPIIGPANAMRFAEHLDLSLAGRRDDYSDVGSTDNYKIGLAWAPGAGLTLRGSRSTSFRAPNAQDAVLDSVGQFLVLFPLNSPAGGTETALLTTGSAGGLQPETSQNISGGIEYKPTWLPSVRMSLDYYSIKYKDRIGQASLDPSALLQPDIYGSLITTFQTDAQAQAFETAFLATGATRSNYVTLPPGIRHVFDLRFLNISRLDQAGWDFLLGHDRDLAGGRLSTGLTLSYIDHIETRFKAATTAADFANLFGNPLKLRGRAQASWAGTQWTFSSALNYQNSYIDTTTTPRGTLDRYLTVDGTVSYAPSQWSGMSFRLAAVNLFDRQPPRLGRAFRANVLYDPANASPLGRSLSFQVIKQW